MGKKGKRKGKKGKGGGGYLSPGVYVEEVPSGSRPLEGVGTAIAAFVGFAEKGPGTIWRRAGTRRWQAGRDVRWWALIRSRGAQ